MAKLGGPEQRGSLIANSKLIITDGNTPVSESTHANEEE